MKIKLLKKYIAYDVRQIVHRMAEARITENGELRVKAQLGENESDVNLITRYITSGIARMVRIINDYIECRHDDADDKLEENAEYTFHFKDDVADSQSLAGLMHWFVVKFAVCEWARAYGTRADVQSCKEELDDLESDLSDLLLSSNMPTKERRKIEEIADEYEVEIIYEPYGQNG